MFDIGFASVSKVFDSRHGDSCSTHIPYDEVGAKILQSALGILCVRVTRIYRVDLVQVAGLGGYTLDKHPRNCPVPIRMFQGFLAISQMRMLLGSGSRMWCPLRPK